MGRDFIVPGGLAKTESLVPVLTSNNQDGFVLSSNSTMVSNEHVMFNGNVEQTLAGSSNWNDNLFWWAVNYTPVGELFIELPQAKKLVSACIVGTANASSVSYLGVAYPSSASFFYSLDGIEYKELQVAASAALTNFSIKNYVFSNSPSARFFKIQFTSLNGAHIGVSEILLGGC